MPRTLGHHSRGQVYQEGKGEDARRAEGDPANRVSEIVPPQANDPNGHEGRDQAGDDHERGADHAACGPPSRVMQQDAKHGGKGHGGRGMPLGNDS
jgi:hypothetical protein